MASIQFEILITPTVRTYYLTPGDTSTYTYVEVSGFSAVPLLLLLLTFQQKVLLHAKCIESGYVA